MALSPKREEAAQLDKDIAAAQQQLDQSKQEKVTVRAGAARLPADVRESRAPRQGRSADEDVPSLLVQLNHAAAQANVDFRSVALTLDESAAGAPAAPRRRPAAGRGHAQALREPAPAGATGATGAAGATE